MSVPRLSAVRLGGSPAFPLLVLGPSLGTSASALWSRCAAGLRDRFEVLAWDLPGHGNSTKPSAAFTVAELAAGVLALVDDLVAERGEQGTPFYYAGDSLGGAVGLQLLLDVPQRVEAAVLLCTGARIGDPELWQDRAATVRAGGTAAVVEGSVQRWFGAGFVDAEPEAAATLLSALRDADDEAYALACEALGRFDVRRRLGEISAPVLAVAGSEDVAAPPAGLEEIADGVRHGRLVQLQGTGHLAPAERPFEVAQLIRDHVDGVDPDAARLTVEEVRAAGMAVRREVLGAAHVDRAAANTTGFTADFQDLITQYAWGSIWTRPGLDRRSRSMITLTALVARGHHEELALHLRAARTNGLTDKEIKELLLQTAIYCGVPDANTAFRIAQRVLAELDEEATS